MPKRTPVPDQCLVCRRRFDRGAVALPVCDGCCSYGARVYAIKCGGLLKIGSTGGFKSRMMCLRHENHDKPIVLMALQTFDTRDAALRREKKVHRALAVHRNAPDYRREWYKPSNPMRDELLELFSDGLVFFSFDDDFGKFNRATPKEQ